MKRSSDLLDYTLSKDKRADGQPRGKRVLSPRLRKGMKDAAHGRRQNKTEHPPTLGKGQALKTTGMSAAQDEARTGLERLGEQGAKP